MPLIQAAAIGEILVGIVALWFNKYEVAQTAILLSIAFMMFDKPRSK